MSTTDSRRSLAAWGTAGVPLLMTLVQTLMALFGYTSENASVEPIADPLLSVPVLFEAAVVFKDSSGIVMGLFLLIAVAWVGQGVSMFSLEQREASYGAVSLAAVLFFALFFGVYAPLFSSGVSTVQLFVFALVPVVASGLMVYAAYDYPWARTVERQANADIGAIESTLDAAERTYLDEHDRRFGNRDLDRLSSIAEDAVESVREDRRAFEETVADSRDRIAEIRSVEDPEARHRQVTDVKSRVDALDVEDRLDTVESEFRERLASAVETRHGDETIRSSFGGTYELLNLPTRFREIDVPGADGPVHRSDIGVTLRRLVTDGESFSVVADAITAVEQERERVEAFLDREETPIRESVDTATDDMAAAEAELDRRDTPFQSRLEEVVIDGRSDVIEGTKDLRREIEAAKRSLHSCDFDTARERVESVVAASDSLVVTVEFGTTLSTAIENQSGSLSRPAELSTELLDVLTEAVEREYDGVTATVTSDAVEFSYPDQQPEETAQTDTDDEEDDETPVETARGTETVAATDEVVDEVLFVLRELAGETDGSETVFQYNLDDLPSSMARPDVLVNVRRFTERQTDLFDTVTLQSPEPPGFVEFTPADGTVVGEALEETRERFRERYA